MGTSPYLGCMLAAELDFDRVVYPVAVEDKLDGFRVTFIEGQGYTRNGRTYESFKPFATALHAAFPGLHIDTEMVAPNWNETSKLLKRIKNVDVNRIRELVTCHVFDVFDQAALGVAPYSERREAVEIIVRETNALQRKAPYRYHCDYCEYDKPLPGDREGDEYCHGWRYRFVVSEMVICHNREELEAAFDAAIRRGREGIMVKSLSGTYELKRSRAWMKRKPFKDITVTITGHETGHGLCTSCMTVDRRELRAAAHNEAVRTGYAEGSELERDDIKPDPKCVTCSGAATGIARPDVLGSMLCVTEDGKPVKVGMGLDDATKEALLAELIAGRLQGKKCDVKVQVESGANEIIARHPVFLRLREDV